MKKLILSLSIIFVTYTSSTQTAADLFSGNTKVSWLGIDFSHTKLIGGFDQVQGALVQSPMEIRNDYFPAWNKLIINEAKKYDVNAMLRKDNVRYDIDMIMRVNATTPLGELEAYNAPDYSKDDIKKFVKEYKIENKEGLGIVFINECLNKAREEAVFHVVVLNMKTNEVLIYERVKGKPQGFGLRNFWAGAIYSVIKQVRNKHYGEWKTIHSKM